MAAAHGGNLAIVQALIQAKASLDMQKNGATALMNAAIEGHHEVAGLLLEAGASLDLKEEEGCTALTLAALVGRGSVVSVLLASDLFQQSSALQAPKACPRASDSHRVLPDRLSAGF